MALPSRPVSIWRRIVFDSSQLPLENRTLGAVLSSRRLALRYDLATRWPRWLSEDWRLNN